MASNDRLPPELDCADLAKEWPIWKRTFLMYMMANGKHNLGESQKIATFLWLIGPRAMDIYNTLYPNDGTSEDILGNQTTATNGEAEQTAQDHRKLDEILKTFDAYCTPMKNVAMESFKFNTMTQKEKQSFIEFETELRKQLQYCEYKCQCGKSYEERMLRDRIIIGVHDKRLQLKLLDGKDESLKKVINTSKIFEAANANKVLLDRGAEQSIVQSVSEQPDLVNAITRQCHNCGLAFTPAHLRVCKAKNVVCYSCGRRGHFQKFCRQSKARRYNQESKPTSRDTESSNQKTNSIKWNNAEGNYDFRINTATNGSGRTRWIKAYKINSEVINFKIDTGSDVNCVPLNLIRKLNMAMENQQNNFPVFDYSENKIKIFGTVKLECLDLKSHIAQVAEFLVVNNEFEPLLGLDACIEFGLVKRMDVHKITCFPQTKEELVGNNRDIFGGLGKFPGKFSIKLKENATPVLHYKKRIPLSLIEKLKVEIDCMVETGIISPVDYPTEWVNNLQIVEKPNGKLRICLDPKPLNECIQREHFLIPTIEDCTSRLANKRIFTVLDLSCGFWHMELDNISAELTTFMTPFGKFKFNRVPFGVNCAPEMFQRKMVQIFGDIPDVVVYFDDIGITAENEVEHDKTLSLVMERARANGIKFNPEKIQYRKSEVQFMGHVLSNGQIKPTNKYRDAILEMKTPENKHDVMRLLGLFKYLAKFIPNLSKQSTALRNLTRKEIGFEWKVQHQEEFKNLLMIISSDPVLSVYDPKKAVVVQTDASKDGLGCVLMQEGHPVAYSSRTLSKSEQRWAQIEKELLAIVFACQRFHFYLYGREFTVESDHKPLETLVKRDIDDVTARLQRMFLMLLRYPKMTVIYKPGKEMLVADCLSRAQLKENTEINELSGIIHSVTKSACLSEDNYKLYCSIMERDERYMRICSYVENGWPTYHKLDDLSQEFFKYKAELHCENGLLFRNHKLVIPTELQNEISRWLHAPHLGIEKTLARARMHYFWPKMNSQIKEITSKCTICEKFKRNNQKEPLVQEETPKYPFHRVSMDIFEYAGRDFIALIDAYSNYLIAEPIRSKTSKHVIEVICGKFNTIGYPTIIKCDNSPFGSGEFERFASAANIQLKFSSPRYPQSNGLAEKGVAIAKNILKRCYEAQEVHQFQYRILEYNTTPVVSLKLSPAQLFFGRAIKAKLPIADSLLCRNNVSENSVQEKLQDRKERQKYYYDRNAKELSLLKASDRVIFKKTGKEWNYGTIVENINDRSYIIRDSFDNFFRRNRRFISKTSNTNFNASEMILDDNIKNQVDRNEDLKEILIMQPECRGTQESVNIELPEHRMNESAAPVNIEIKLPSVNELVPPVEAEIPKHPIAEPTHGGDRTDAFTIEEPQQYQTRSGRLIKPPRRYGHD